MKIEIKVVNGGLTVVTTYTSKNITIINSASIPDSDIDSFTVSDRIISICEIQNKEIKRIIGIFK